MAASVTHITPIAGDEDFADVVVEMSPTRFFVVKNRFGSCEAFTRTGFAIFVEKLAIKIGGNVNVLFRMKERQDR